MYLEVRNYRAEDREVVIRLDKLVLAEVQASGLPSQFDDF
jgi:hypothetical protein